jgi:hypothetical protein
MLHRRPAAAVILALLTALCLLVLPGAAAGAEQRAMVRLAHFAPGLQEGDVYVVYLNGRLQLKGVPFKTVSDYLKVRPGRFRVEVRKPGQAAGKSKLRFIQALPGDQAVDLAADGGVLFSGARFPPASRYLQVPASPRSPASSSSSGAPPDR